MFGPEAALDLGLKKEYTAYSGPKYTIEWYFDEKGHSQPSTYFYNLNSRRQDKLMYLFRRMGDFGKILDITKFRNEGTEFTLSNLSLTDFCVFSSKETGSLSPMLFRRSRTSFRPLKKGLRWGAEKNMKCV